MMISVACYVKYLLVLFYSTIRKNSEKKTKTLILNTISTSIDFYRIRLSFE